MYKVFGDCSVKEKWQGNNAQKQQNRKSHVQTTQNPFFAPKPNACANFIKLGHPLVIGHLGTTKTILS